MTDQCFRYINFFFVTIDRHAQANTNIHTEGNLSLILLVIIHSLYYVIYLPSPSLPPSSSVLYSPPPPPSPYNLHSTTSGWPRLPLTARVAASPGSPAEGLIAWLCLRFTSLKLRVSPLLPRATSFLLTPVLLQCVPRATHESARTEMFIYPVLFFFMCMCVCPTIILNTFFFLFAC